MARTVFELKSVRIQTYFRIAILYNHCAKLHGVYVHWFTHSLIDSFIQLIFLEHLLYIRHSYNNHWEYSKEQNRLRSHSLWRLILWKETDSAYNMSFGDTWYRDKAKKRVSTVKVVEEATCKRTVREGLLEKTAYIRRPMEVGLRIMESPRKEHGRQEAESRRPVWLE